MSGPTLLGLIGAELIGGGSKKHLLEGTITSEAGLGSVIIVDEADKQRAVEQFLEG